MAEMKTHTAELVYVDDSGDTPGKVIVSGDISKQRQRNWTFTIFYNTVDEIKAVSEGFPKLDGFRGLMFEHEICPSTQRMHMQGFICFASMKSGAQMKRIHGSAHWEAMRGSIESNKAYCSKEAGSPVTVIGSFPASAKEKGTRGAPHGTKAPDMWSAMRHDIEGGMSKRDVMANYMKIVWGCEKSLDRYFDEFAPKTKFDIVAKHGSFLPWQAQLMDILALGADARSVVWIYSPEGNVGKSDMFKHLVCNKGFEPLMNAPTRDLSCAWKCGDVAFDLARDLGDAPINYSFMEQVKNGFAFSAKYESKCKIADCTKPRWVVCFANQAPDTSKLSKDRWAIFRVIDAVLVWEDVIA